MKESERRRTGVGYGGLGMSSLLGSSGSAGAAKRFRGHEGRLGPARVRRQGRKRRRWCGPQAQPRTRAPQRPLTGEAHAEARQAASAARRWREAPRSATGENRIERNRPPGPQAECTRKARWQGRTKQRASGPLRQSKPRSAKLITVVPATIR